MKLILFDCDGTLVDSQHQHIACMGAAYEAVSLPLPSRDALLAVVGLSLPQCFEYLLGADADAYNSRMVTAYKAHHHTQRSAGSTVGPLYAGMTALLDRLAATEDVYLGVATGNSRYGLALVLKTHGLADHFVVLKTADDARSKPDPDMIHQAMAELGVGLEKTLMIGDTTHDLSMANAAQVAAIGVSYGYHKRQHLAGMKPRAICDTTSHLDVEIDKWLDQTRSAVAR
jgi:phosphoglycolate phosphatase